MDSLRKAAVSVGRVSLIRAADLVASPWRNGGGVTREIAAVAAPKLASAPATAALDTFAWRVSVADVAQPGPFSRFPGVDRTLVLLSGAGMTLVDAAGPRHVLDKPLARADFAGEAAIDATLADGATRDFNLMTRRSAASGALSVWHAGTHRVERAGTALLFCARGEMTVALTAGGSLDGDSAAGGVIELAEMDTLRLDDVRQAFDVVVSGEGALLAVTLRVTGGTESLAPSLEHVESERAAPAHAEPKRTAFEIKVPEITAPGPMTPLNPKDA